MYNFHKHTTSTVFYSSSIPLLKTAVILSTLDEFQTDSNHQIAIECLLHTVLIKHWMYKNKIRHLLPSRSSQSTGVDKIANK